MTITLKTPENTNSLTDSERKHIPALFFDGKKVIVQCGYGIIHPMTDDHYIVYIELFQNGQSIGKKNLSPGDEPKAMFEVESIENIKAHAFCNTHGIWESL